MRRILSPGRLIGAGLLLLATVAAILYLTPSSTYIFLPDRAHPVEPLVRVQGGHRPTGPGGIYFIDILVRKATLLERLFPGIRSGSQLVPTQQVRSPCQGDRQRRQADRREMRRSQQVAAAVALGAAGYKVTARPTGAFVEDVDPHAPAACRLLPADVIVSVDGSPVRRVADLRRLVRARPVGSALEIGVRRGSALQTLSLRTVADPHQQGKPVIGVLVRQAADIHLPFSVGIDAGNVGGPSAGLAFALQVLEELGRDVDHGYRVAATGEIQLDGSVGPIGGIVQKTIGVRHSGIDVFLVPVDNAPLARQHAGRLRVIPVSNFQQALHVLATLRRK